MPYRVCYYVYDIGTNALVSPKVKYKNILLKEEAEMRAKSLLKQLKAYYRVHLADKTKHIETFVADNTINEIYDVFK